MEKHRRFLATEKVYILIEKEIGNLGKNFTENCTVLCNFHGNMRFYWRTMYLARGALKGYVAMSYKTERRFTMAKRRCIAVDIYESEEFFCLSDKAKALYTYFILRSDDEGVIINPKTAMRLCMAGEETLRELIENGFVLEVGEIFVIRHWYAHNRIQPSRCVPSLFSAELEYLRVNQTKAYEFVDNLSTNCRPNIIKDNINKNNVIKSNSNEMKLNEEKERLPLPIPSLGRKTVNIDHD